MMHTFEASPDGNWIAYGGYCQSSLYFGDLVHGHVQVFGQDDSQPNFSWSPDSNHLIIGRSIVVTSFEKSPMIIAGDGYQWIDANQFISRQERFLIGEIRGDEIFYHDLGLSFWGYVTIKPK